jgi:DNA-binding transcriptional LysR family regulator
MDKFANMQAFALVAQTGSFAEAARKLNIANSVVSKRVKDLEDYLGTQLLIRTTRSVRLSDTGYGYLEQIRKTLDELAEIESRIREKMEHPIGTIRLEAPLSFGMQYLAPALASYLEKYPQTEVHVYLSDRRNNFVEAGCDIAISTGPFSDSSLMTKKLASCRRVVCASPAYLKKHGTPRTPDDLKNHQCLSYLNVADGKAWPFLQDGKTIWQNVAGRFSADNGDLLHQAILGDAGLSLLPTFIVGKSLKSGALKAVLSDYEEAPFNLYAAYPYTRHVSPKIRTLVDHLSSCLFGEPGL